MQNETFDTANNLNKSAYDAMRQLMEINTRALTKLFEKQMSVAASCMSHSIEQTEIARDIKDFPAYLSKQTSLLKACGEEATEASKSMLDILTETRDEMLSLMETSMGKATESAKTVAASVKSVAKKAA